MKNTIVIDATKNCICDLVSTVDNGENRFFIEIRADTSLNPRLEIESEQIQITGSPFVLSARLALPTMWEPGACNFGLWTIPIPGTIFR